MKALKKITPDFVKSAYHKVRGVHAAAKNSFPGKKMIVIGVTGTKGKTSTSNYIWSVLSAGGYKTGLISTALFRIGDEQKVNSYHMTMPSPYFVQNKLAEMQRKGIEIAIVEMTSEGMKQHRHTGIPVDIAVFTNLTPEHLTSHKGSFELYKKAKSPLFQALDHRARKLRGKEIPPTIIANADSEHADYYLSFKASQKITFGRTNGTVRAENIVTEKNKTTFIVDTEPLALSIPGTFNVYNALPAVIIGKIFDIPIPKIREGLLSLDVIPGRMELINEGQNFTVVVDYAHEPASLGALLEAAQSIKSPSGKIILLTGVIGGGREPRFSLTELAAKKSDYLIITNEDPYDSDPEVLISALLPTAIAAGKELNQTLFAPLDRREGIKKALSLASEGDIVLISGKGAEHTMMTARGAIPWNERAIVRELTSEFVCASK